RVGDIERLGVDIYPISRETGERLPRLGARRATPSGKDQMARAALSKPARRRQTESAATPSDKMRLVSRGLEPPARRNSKLTCLGRRDDDFADMAGLLHEPHRVDEFARPEGAIRQRGEFAVHDKLDDFLEQLPA